MGNLKSEFVVESNTKYNNISFTLIKPVFIISPSNQHLDTDTADCTFPKQINFGAKSKFLAKYDVKYDFKSASFDQISIGLASAGL